MILLIDNLFKSDEEIDKLIEKLSLSFKKKNEDDINKGLVALENSELTKLLQIKKSNQKVQSIINACSDWVIEYHKDFARMPNDNEWMRFLKSPLNGKIGMSFALQWRYNFGSVFPKEKKIIEKEKIDSEI